MLAVLTAAVLDATAIGSVSVPVPVPGSPGMVSTPRPSLARDCVRHVGDPVALVVATRCHSNRANSRLKVRNRLREMRSPRSPLMS